MFGCFTVLNNHLFVWTKQLVAASHHKMNALLFFVFFWDQLMSIIIGIELSLVSSVHKALTSDAKL